MKSRCETRFERAVEAFGHIPGVLAIGSSLKQTAGQLFDVPALQITVRRKRPSSEIRAAERIPAFFEGFPTDVWEPIPTIPAGNPTMAGGMPAASSQVFDGGSVGCFATKGGQTVLLTAGHVLFDGTGPVDANLDVGVPELSCCWPCTTGVVGTTLVGQVDQDLDCVVVQLNGRKAALQSIPGLGSTIVDGIPTGQNVDLIMGVAPQNPDPVTQFLTPVVLKQHVRKVGSTTHLTGGRVIAFNAPLPPDTRVARLPAMVSQIVIAPLQAESFIDKEGRYHFCQFGDSGAVIMDDSNLVAALLVRAADLTGQGGTTPQTGFGGGATDINRIISKLGIVIFTSPVPNLTTKPAYAFRPGSRLFRPPAATPRDLEVRAVFDQLKGELGRSALGQLLLDFLDHHHAEVGDLVKHARRVKVAWHRAHGPAFVAQLLRGARNLDQPIPSEVEGVAIDDALRATHAALEASGSPALVADMTPLWGLVERIVPRSGTLRELVDNIGAVEQP